MEKRWSSPTLAATLSSTKGQDYKIHTSVKWRKLVSLVILFVCLGFGVGVSSVQTPAVSIDEKSQKIIDHAIEAVGGPSYLNVQTVIGKGFYTPFNQGVSQPPSRFLDYISYPDRERTEFSSSGVRTIQTNTGD